MAASHRPLLIPKLQQAPSKPRTPQYQQEFDQQQPLTEHLASKATATTVIKLHHKLHEPARSVQIVPQVQNSLFSTSKVVNADYIAIYDKEEVNFYDAKTTRITVSEEAVLKGWQCPAAGLW
jgi:hypothetical protein